MPRRRRVELLCWPGPRSMLHAYANVHGPCTACAAAGDGCHDPGRAAPHKQQPVWLCCAGGVVLSSPLTLCNAGTQHQGHAAGVLARAEADRGQGVATPTLPPGVVADAPHCSCSCCSRKDARALTVSTPGAAAGAMRSWLGWGGADGVLGKQGGCPGLGKPAARICPPSWQQLVSL